MKREKVLITGGRGFLGTRLASALEQSYDVVSMSMDRTTGAQAKESTDWPSVSAEITEIDSLRTLFEDVRPKIVIHAAAMKSVGQAEKQPLECADINVIGSQNIARIAMETNCSLVVGLSSTRAAPPTGDTYGLTKALMERMFCSLDGKTETQFVSVRLGNIAWSPGSVLPIWQQMLDESGVIGTTGPDMRRFFMNAEDAVELVQTAVEQIGEFHGRVLARHMKQAQIRNVLARFVKLKGGTWEQVDRRLGDRGDEILIGDLELPYCTQTALNGVDHYVLHFNEKAENPMSREVSTETVEALSDSEIDHMIMQEALATGGGR